MGGVYRAAPVWINLNISNSRRTDSVHACVAVSRPEGCVVLDEVMARFRRRNRWRTRVGRTSGVGMLYNTRYVYCIYSHIYSCCCTGTASRRTGMCGAAAAAAGYVIYTSAGALRWAAENRIIILRGGIHEWMENRQSSGSGQLLKQTFPFKSYEYSISRIGLLAVDVPDENTVPDVD